MGQRLLSAVVNFITRPGIWSHCTAAKHGRSKDATWKNPQRRPRKINQLYVDNLVWKTVFLHWCFYNWFLTGHKVRWMKVIFYETDITQRGCSMKPTSLRGLCCNRDITPSLCSVTLTSLRGSKAASRHSPFFTLLEDLPYLFLGNIIFVRDLKEQKKNNITKLCVHDLTKQIHSSSGTDT